jgi:hypothetical protein
MVTIDDMVATRAEELEAVGELNDTYVFFALPPPRIRNFLDFFSSCSAHSSIPIR